MKYTFPIIAINRDNTTRMFYNGQDLLDFVNSTKLTKWGRAPVGETWTYWEYSWCRYTSEPKKNEWILRDDRGRSVDYTVFVPATPDWRNHKGNFEYRNGPVPGRTHSSGGWKMNHTAKKNSGSGARQRARANAVEAFNQYRIRNPYGKPIRYEHW